MKWLQDLAEIAALMMIGGGVYLAKGLAAALVVTGAIVLIVSIVGRLLARVRSAE